MFQLFANYSQNPTLLQWRTGDFPHYVLDGLVDNLTDKS